MDKLFAIAISAIVLLLITLFGQLFSQHPWMNEDKHAQASGLIAGCNINGVIAKPGATITIEQNQNVISLTCSESVNVTNRKDNTSVIDVTGYTWVKAPLSSTHLHESTATENPAKQTENI